MSPAVQTVVHKACARRLGPALGNLTKHLPIEASVFHPLSWMRPAAVRVSFGSLMVQRDQWDTSWGAKKLIFLIRDTDDAAMVGASVESCRFVVLRSPGGRFWSVVDVGNRLDRTRGGFHRSIHISKVLCALIALDHDLP